MEWKTDAGNEEMAEEPYSSFTKGGGEMPGGKTKTPFIIIGGGVLVLILLFFIFNPGPSEKQNPDMAAVASRLNALEKKVADLEVLNKGASETGRPETTASQGSLEYQQLVNWIKSNSEVISETIKKMSLLEKRVDQIQGRAPAKKLKASRPAVEKKKPTAVKPKAAPSLPVKVQAKKQTVQLRYHTVKKGENLYRISLRYHTTVKKLQRLNRMGSSITITPGQRLVVGTVKR